jgi:CRP/FNR family transcriptional regulator, cyclic AMP receptor protein
MQTKTIEKSIDDKIWYLKEFNIIKALNEEERKMVSNRATMKEYEKKSLIQWQDWSHNHIYFLKRGHVKLTKINKKGKERVLDILGQGEIFGKLYMENSGADETIHAISIEDSLVCIIKQQNWMELLQEIANLSISVFKIANEKMIRLETKIEQLHFKSSEDRIKFVLKDMADRFGKKIGLGFEIEIKLGLTHQDIASLTGTSRQRTSMLLKQMENENIISYNRRRLLIKNYDAL